MGGPQATSAALDDAPPRQCLAYERDRRRNGVPGTNVHGLASWPSAHAENAGGKSHTNLPHP